MARGSDFLHLDLAAAPSRGLAAWLTSQLRAGISDGRLAPGSQLPATRTLAADLGTSRGVVVEAYRRLTDEGLVEGRRGAGSRVSQALVQYGATPTARNAAPDAGQRRLVGRDRLPVVAAPGAIDLSPGRPDLSAFPRAAWLRAERAVFDQTGTAELGYGDPQGHPRLRRELAQWLRRTRGARVADDGLVVVAGVAQALALLAQVLTATGTHEVGVEDPGSKGAREQLNYWGLRPTSIPVDDDGLVVDEIPSRIRVVVTTPAHQFPTGVVLAPQRRLQLLEWARDGHLVIEDDYDAEHRYDRAPVPALHASAPESVAYTGSTSKALAPGLRLGWLAPPAHLLARVAEAKYSSDLGSSVLPQLVLAELLSSGAYDRHLRQVRARQRQRRDELLAALAVHLPDAHVDGVAAGLHLLVRLPDNANDTEIAERTREAGVVVHPLSWHRIAPGGPGLVLGYAAESPGRLAEAAAILGRAVSCCRE